MSKIIIKRGINILLGLVVGIMIHYLLYRYTLPAKAFIYVSF